MRVSVGHISACCVQCGGEEFQPVPGDTSPAHELVCFGCGLCTTRRALLMQIADETVRRAEAFLEKSRRQREKRPR
jgi:hypothetical protein